MPHVCLAHLLTSFVPLQLRLKTGVMIGDGETGSVSVRAVKWLGLSRAVCRAVAVVPDARCEWSSVRRMSAQRHSTCAEVAALRLCFLALAYLASLHLHAMAEADGRLTQVRDPSHKESPTDKQDEAALKRAVRSAGNFSEHTPFAFFLIFISELNGAPTAIVHGAYTTLFLARVAHDIGIKAPNSVGLGRPIGFAVTALLTVGAGAYNVSRGRGGESGGTAWRSAGSEPQLVVASVGAGRLAS